MLLSSRRDPDADARCAPWLARGAARYRTAHRRFITVVPVAFAIALIVHLWFVR